MKITDISVKRPVATAMAFLAVLLFGIVSWQKLPLDIMPKMELPTLTVITAYPGASAGEVEKQVTKPLEALLAGAENMKEIESSSKENVSFISLQYRWKTDITEAANNVRDLIELSKRHLPEEAHNPVIFKVNSSMLPVLVYGINADENFQGIENIIEDNIASPIRKIEGVGTVIYLGQPQREIKVTLNPAKIRAYNISPTQIATVLKAENIKIPGGNIKTGDFDFSIDIPGEINKTTDLAEIPIVNFNHKIIKLKDIAEIEDGFKETDEYIRTEKGPGVAFMIQKQSGANTLEVVNAVRSQMDEIRQDLPDDVEVFEIISTDEVITQSIGNLSESLLYAFIIVILVVFIFLREWRSSIIVSLTIPFSLIVAFITMYVLDYTINIFSLISLIIAIGMVVDNAIVILENITKKIEEGLPPYKAAIEGAKEMGMAISASTATTLMVFIPLIFMGGIVGIMFKQLAILTSVTMIASLITSLSLTPMISSRLLKKKNEKAERKFSFFKWSENIFVAIESAYKKLLAWVIFHKSVTILFVLAILVLSIYTGKKIGSDYIPEFDAGDVTVVFETEVGTRADATGKIGEKIASIMQDEIPERVPGSIAVIAGQTQDGILSSVGFSEGKNVGTVMCHLELPDERERSAKEIGEVLRARLEEIPEIERFHVSAGSILSAALLGNNKPIEVFLSGKHFEELNSTARSVEEYFENCGYLTDVESTIDNGKNQIEIHIDRKKASALGLNVAMVGMQVRQGIYGTDAGTLSDEGEDYDITLMYGEDFKKDITDIGNIQLTNLRGEKITLSSVADIRMGKGKLEIRRKSQQRYVVVKANLDQISLGEAAANVNQFLADFDLPEGVTAEIAGQVENKDESFGDLYLIFMLGILLVYMVMAAQFESFKHPLIIMLSVPFTAIGVIWAFAITGLTLSVTTFIGIIMLIGIVVNNGIVLVDYINQLRRKGAKLTDAVLESGSSRLRPVLMTTLTTVCAMIPMAASTGMGKEMFSPLGITIIGGLLVSTLITLLFVPAVYIAFHPNELKKEKNK